MITLTNNLNEKKDFVLSDVLRKELKELGWIIKEYSILEKNKLNL